MTSIFFNYYCVQYCQGGCFLHHYSKSSIVLKLTLEPTLQDIELKHIIHQGCYSVTLLTTHLCFRDAIGNHLC
jgi:hypothetical protein